MKIGMHRVYERKVQLEYWLILSLFVDTCNSFEEKFRKNKMVKKLEFSYCCCLWV